MTTVKSHREVLIVHLEQRLVALHRADEESAKIPHVIGHVEEPDPIDYEASVQLLIADLVLLSRKDERREYVTRRIQRVLARLKNGWNGACECGEAIPAERLLAIKGTQHCVACTQHRDRNGEGDSFRLASTGFAHA